MAGRQNFADLSQQERQELIKNILTDNDALRGNNFAILSNAVDIIGRVDDTLALAEVAGLLSKLPTWAGAATRTSSALAIFLFPVGSFLSVINAYETGHRHYGMRAIAYAATSWAFNKRVLERSRKLEENLTRGIARVSNEDLQTYKKAWKEATKQTINKLNQTSVIYRTSTSSLKVLLRAMGNDKPGQLCLVILKRFEREMSGIEKIHWTNKYKLLYPN